MQPYYGDPTWSHRPSSPRMARISAQHGDLERYNRHSSPVYSRVGPRETLAVPRDPHRSPQLMPHHQPASPRFNYAQTRPASPLMMPQMPPSACLSSHAEPMGMIPVLPRLFSAPGPASPILTPQHMSLGTTGGFESIKNPALEAAFPWDPSTVSLAGQEPASPIITPQHMFLGTTGGFESIKNPALQAAFPGDPSTVSLAGQLSVPIEAQLMLMRLQPNIMLSPSFPLTSAPVVNRVSNIPPGMQYRPINSKVPETMLAPGSFSTEPGVYDTGVVFY